MFRFSLKNIFSTTVVNEWEQCVCLKISFKTITIFTLFVKNKMVKAVCVYYIFNNHSHKTTFVYFT